LQLYREGKLPELSFVDLSVVRCRQCIEKMDPFRDGVVWQLRLEKFAHDLDIAGLRSDKCVDFAIH
jgi:hypothetical protein